MNQTWFIHTHATHVWTNKVPMAPDKDTQVHQCITECFFMAKSLTVNKQEMRGAAAGQAKAAKGILLET